MTTHTLPILMAWGICPPDISGFEAAFAELMNVISAGLAGLCGHLMEFGAAVVRAVQVAVRVRHLRTHHDSEIISPTCSALTTMSPADVVTTHSPSPAAGTEDTHTLNRASNAR